jgi:hypothetical protein
VIKHRGLRHLALTVRDLDRTRDFTLTCALLLTFVGMPISVRATDQGMARATHSPGPPKSTPSAAPSPTPTPSPVPTLPSEPTPTASMEATPVTSPSARAIGVEILPPGGPPYTSARIIAALKVAASAGVDADHMVFKWSDLETGPGAYNPTAIKGLRDGIAYLGGALGWQLQLTISVIDTTVKATPNDLKRVAWNDPKMIKRFHALIDKIAPTFNPHLAYIAVGNEVDLYLDGHPSEWPKYKAFYDDAVAYIHQKVPGLQVGVCTTFENTINAAQSRVQDLIGSSDVVVFTYYPLDRSFRPLGPTTPLADFPRMVTFAGAKPVVLQEVGYPSSPKLGSSVQDEAAFVLNVFSAWRQVGAQIPFLSYWQLYDFSLAYCNTFPVYYGFRDPHGYFVAYICSNGLRYADGSPKPAWDDFVQSVPEVTGRAGASSAR